MRAVPVLCAGLWLLAASPPAAGAEAPAVRRSTAAGTVPLPAAPAPIPITMTFIRDRYDWRVEAGYSLRWDFGDLRDIGPGLRRLVTSPGSLLQDRTLDIAQSTRLMLYGVRISPWKLLVEERRRPASPGASSAGPAGTGPSEETRRRLRLSLGPFIEDIRANARRDLGRYVLKQSFNQLGPGSQALNDVEREAVVRDVFRAGEEHRVPYLAFPEDGFDLLMDRKQP